MNQETSTTLIDSASTFERMGTIYQAQNNYEEAVNFYRKAIAEYKKLKDKANLARLFNKVGEVYDNWKDSALAVDWKRISLLVHERLDTQSEQAQFEVSKSVREQGKDIALTFMLQSLILSGRLGSLPTAISAGDVCYLLGEYEQSLKWYEKALNNQDVSKSDASIGRVQLRIARAYEGMQDHDGALKVCRETWTFAEQLKDTSLLASVQNQMGLTYLAQEDFSTAFSNFEQAYNLYAEIDDPVGLAVSRHHIGLLHYDQTDYDRAIEFFQRALEVSLNLGSASDVVASSCNCVSLVHYDQRNFEQAAKFAHKCVTVSERTERLHYLSFAYSMLGKIHHEKSENKEALYWYYRAYSLQQALDMKASLALSSTLIGKVYSTEGFTIE